MRIVGMGAAVLLAACGAEETPPAAGHEAAVAACAAAVATHVGKGTDAVTANWAGTTAAGAGIVAVTDAGGSGGERLHQCEVDGAGRVLAIRHPGA